MKRHEIEHKTNFDNTDLARLVFMNIIYFFVLYSMLNCIRIFVSTNTVANKLVVKQLTSQTNVMVSEYRNLLVERSLAYDMDRIERIATENYGMVLADDVDYITINESE